MSETTTTDLVAQIRNSSRYRGEVQHHNHTLAVMEESYTNNGRVALQLIDLHISEPWCVATTNLPQVSLEKDEICIKNWSENEGILDALVEGGIVEDTGKVEPTGHVVANVVRYLKAKPKEEDERAGGDEES